MLKTIQRGYSLLEQAAVLPVIVVLVVGVFDLNNAIQGYSAVKEGVHQTLRCLYPTDSACVVANADTRERLYDVSQVTAADTKVYGSEIDYAGTASWFNRPVYEASSGIATIAGTVRYSVPMKGFEGIREDIVNPNAVAPYLIRTYSLPYVSGTALDAEFGTGPTGRASTIYPPADMILGGAPSSHRGRLSIDPGPIVLATSGNTAVTKKTEELIIEHPLRAFADPSGGTQGRLYDGVPCYNSLNIDGAPDAPHQANFGSPCPKNATNILIHVTGSLPAGADMNGAGGSVGLKLVTGDRNERALGGRMITMTRLSNTNLAPRGMIHQASRGGRDCPGGNPSSNVQDIDIYERTSPQVIRDYPCEAEFHQDIRVKFGEKFHLEFTLESTDGQPVEWKANKITIYHSVYKSAIDPTVCEGTFSRAELSSLPTCAASHPTKKGYDIDPNSGTVGHSGSVQVPCTAASGTTSEPITTAAQAIEYLNSHVPNPERYEVKEIPLGSCPNQVHTQNCPSNFGDPAMPAAAGATFSDQSIGNVLCPISDPYLSQVGASPINPVWSTSAQPVRFPPVRWTPANCLELTPQQNQIQGSASKYAHLTFDAPIVVDHERLYTLPLSHEKSPAELKELPQYSCPEFKAISEVYDDPRNSNGRPQQDLDTPFPAESIFLGFHPDLGCTWEEKLRKEAESSKYGAHALSPMAYFVGQKIAGREVRLTNERSCRSNSCKTCRFERTVLESTPLGTYPEGALPAICKGDDLACTLTFAGYQGGTQPSSALDTKLAVDRFGRPAIEAIFPRAHFTEGECHDEFCATLMVEGPDENGNTEQEFAIVTGKIKVPSYLLRPFGKDSFQISYRAQERFEKALLK